MSQNLLQTVADTLTNPDTYSHIHDADQAVTGLVAIELFRSHFDTPESEGRALYTFKAILDAALNGDAEAIQVWQLFHEKLSLLTDQVWQLHLEARQRIEARPDAKQKLENLPEEKQRAFESILAVNAMKDIIAFIHDEKPAPNGVWDVYQKWDKAFREAFNKWVDKKIQNAKEATNSEEFSVHTSQEWTALLHVADDSKRGRNMTTNEQRGSIRHTRPGATHSLDLLLLDEERHAGHGIELLQNAISELDADDKLIWLYVSHLLAPPEPLPHRAFAGDWIDLDDVARKTLGGYAQNPAEAQKRRKKVYHAIRFAARAEIIGKRSTRYIDKQTREELDTRIHTTPWKIMSREEPTQPALWPCETVPVRIELVASREWTAITTRTDTAQYLPFGEIIGAIRPNQAGGAWARAVGLAYLNWCRVHLHDALAGDTPPRRALLDYHTSKVAPYDEVLNGTHPHRALKYWADAEGLLREAQLIEAPKSPTTPRKRQGWHEAWLNERALWKPGPGLRPVLEALAQKKFIEAPRQLNPAKQAAGRKRGRPRKS